MRQVLTVQGRLAGMNELLGAASRHWAARAKLKKTEMERVCWACRQQRLRPVSGRATVSVQCFEPNARRDADNVISGACKIVLDALQVAGILAGDGRRYIRLIQQPVEVDRQAPRVVVTIEEETE